MKLILFHGTDESCVSGILKEGFHCRQSEKHWLGNGIYFYLSKELAEWWTTNPSNSFGTKVEVKALLSVTYEVEDNKVLDLRSLKGYHEFVAAYEKFCCLSKRNLRLHTKHSLQKLRCAFFDWIFLEYDVDCIIGNFNHKRQMYLPQKSAKAISSLRKFYLPFIETQVCVREHIIDPQDVTRF